MSRFQVFVRVVFFHAVILGLIVVVPMLKSCEWFPKKEQIITVDLSSLPPLPPPAEEAEEPEDEEEEEVISEATPVPTPPPQPTATPPPRPTATPAPEATPVPTATPRPLPTPTPKPEWQAVTPEEIARRIREQQNNTPPVAVPTLSAEEMKRLISEGLPTGGGGTGTAFGPGNPGAGMNLGGVDSALQGRLQSAWKQPVHLSAHTGMKAVVSVTILKNGTVSSSRILKSSGNPEFDQSVKEALSVVKFVKALPADYTGSVYTIETTFHLSQ